MEKLMLGKITTANLASWFGIQYGTFRKKPDKYYDILKDYCNFERVYGGVVVKEIYFEEYDKNMSIKDENNYRTEIEYCLKTQNGLSTIAGMSRKLTNAGKYPSESTAKRHLTIAGQKLFGKTAELTSHGTIGSRTYVWAIKLDDYNHYRHLTEDEEKLFDKIITACYASNPQKIKQAALLKQQLKDKIITVDEYFLEEERNDLDTFKDCIFQFKNETGLMIVHCTEHEISESLDFIK